VNKFYDQSSGSPQLRNIHHKCRGWDGWAPILCNLWFSGWFNSPDVANAISLPCFL
jgi:hypothetical protein